MQVPCEEKLVVSELLPDARHERGCLLRYGDKTQSDSDAAACECHAAPEEGRVPESMLTTWRNHMLIGLYRDCVGYRAYSLSKTLFASIEKTERELAAIYGPTYRFEHPTEFDWWRQMLRST